MAAPVFSSISTSSMSLSSPSSFVPCADDCGESYAEEQVEIEPGVRFVARVGSSAPAEAFLVIAPRFRRSVMSEKRRLMQVRVVPSAIFDRTLEVWGSIPHGSTGKTKVPRRDARRFCFRSGQRIVPGTLAVLLNLATLNSGIVP